MVSDKIISEIIEAKNRNGIGPVALANKSGVTYVTINNLLKRRISPRIDTLERVANAVGLTIDVREIV